MSAKYKAMSLVSVIFLLQFLVMHAPAFAQSAMVAGSDIRMYQECSTSCKKYVVVKKGEKLNVKDTKGGWAKVEYKGKKGYALKEGLKPMDSSKAETEGKSAWADEKLTVYKSADRSGGKFGDIERGTKVKLLGTKGDWAKIKVKGETGFVKKAGLTLSEPKNEKAAKKSKVKEVDWWDSGIRSIYSVGTTATVTDVATGISWKEVRKGGTNHADVQPVTARDTAKFKKAIGGTWTWERRAVWVTIGGKRYAASMNCMPHGEGSIEDNEFGGHHCIHFTDSRTHGSNRIDEDHQAAIKRALRYRND